ncbi:YbjQ family protein [Oculatella sp. LEGE 06141]|uniref:YbjQ family protein n=1 Tax=Oculatella sp. LEGE 06141 TaxID=1828648 RepID=UPI00187E3FAE|nr:YbjQ family protein [Oculatella sp. LEGE 06141]MBE9181590.1 YbjQ family protein [Oculatella sp. LEGE 06141]
MILSTTDVIQGAIVEQYLGIVTAEVVYGSNALRDFFAGIRDIIGGRTGSYERVFQRGQQDALDELAKRADRLGANAVIGIEIDTGTINIDQTGALLLITATGTAVKLQNPQDRR